VPAKKQLSGATARNLRKHGRLASDPIGCFGLWAACVARMAGQYDSRLFCSLAVSLFFLNFLVDILESFMDVRKLVTDEG
jgi:hypothetical protein